MKGGKGASPVPPVQDPWEAADPWGGSSATSKRVPHRQPRRVRQADMHGIAWYCMVPAKSSKARLQAYTYSSSTLARGSAKSRSSGPAQHASPVAPQAHVTWRRVDTCDPLRFDADSASLDAKLRLNLATVRCQQGASRV